MLVQAAHVAAIVGCDGNLIVLKAENEKKLVDIFSKLSIINMSPVGFYEPDMNNELTAIAVRVSDTTKKKLSNFPLLKEKDLCKIEV